MLHGPAYRDEVDDAAVTELAHLLMHRLGGETRRTKIHRHLLIPAFGGHIARLDARVIRGVVNQYADTAQCLAGRLYCRLQCRNVSQVAFDEHGPSVGFTLDFIAQLQCFFREYDDYTDLSSLLANRLHEH